MPTAPAMACRSFETPLGRIAIAATAKGLARVWLPPASACAPQTEGGPAAEEHAAQAQREILEFLAGRRRRFTVAIDLGAVPPVHRRFLLAAGEIPYGSTVTYAELAANAGAPKAARAAGQAMARNRLPLIIPCHRVVASGGGLGGYRGGLELKRRLLDLEQCSRP